MKILKELGIILGILFIAHIIQQIAKIPIPATVLGMIILLICLLTGILKLEKIETVSEFFLDHLTFLFIPGGVGLIASLELIKEQWLPILVVIILTTALTIVVTGLTVQLLTGRGKEEIK
ncbi:CidA/LrgA family protein [Tissierella carlieri]|uniref:CidA/LrgA family protein n=1 Tax=Tissierella carlieri TaxID=689904 RepID=A0ABT1S7H6_9FIRM|nr:CidA/LrgA family protein [Tissierella carlieri]MBU5312647.1 CidA/LrgA family protein [Tissierella carlieri]MCQ4922414.1 CidA/LrgA family protein [Tissierella carlieri]